MPSSRARCRRIGRTIYARVAEALDALPGATVAILTDGLAAKDDEASFATLLGQSPASVVWAVPDRLDMVGLTAADNEVDRFAHHRRSRAGRRRAQIRDGRRL